MADHTPSSPRFWRSRAEQAADPAFQEPLQREFEPNSAHQPEDPAAGMSRRRFLGLLGASAALAAGAAGCGRNIDRGDIVPYTRRPEDGLPGRAMWYATSSAEACWVFPLLVKTRESRPILIEGNDSHPDSLGAAPMRAQAELLGLYDPERLQAPAKAGATESWDNALAALASGMGKGKSLLLTGAVVSPSRQALLERLAQSYPGVEIHCWEAAAPHGALAASQQLGAGQLLPRLNLEKARVVLSLEAELFAGEGDLPRQIRAFAAARRPLTHGEATPEGMNRLWAAESRMTLTGGKSDHRLALRSSALPALAFALARRLNELGLAWPGAPLSAPSLAEFAKAEGLDGKLLELLAQDLKQAGPAAVVVAGNQGSAALHGAALVLNRMLGAEGNTFSWRPAALRPLASHAEMSQLGKRLQAGEFATVVLAGVNPVYDGPAGLDWAKALSGAGERFHLGLLPDESAAACTWSLPLNHWLECWGDHMGGLLQQPVVAPLYDTRALDEILLNLLAKGGQSVPADGLSWLKGLWQAEYARQGSPLAFDAFWHASLQQGFSATAFPAAPAPVLSAGALTAWSAPMAASKLELTLHADRRLFDGRGANIGWLQELPDPVTKCTWGNPLSIAPADAKAQSLKDGDRVMLSSGAQSLECTVLVQPGQKVGTCALALGHGRTALSVAEGIGVNAFTLMQGGATVLPNVSLAKATTTAMTHTTQEHQLMEGRDIVRSLPLASFAAGETGAPSHGAHAGGQSEGKGAEHGAAAAAALATGRDHGLKQKEEAPLTLYPDHEYLGHKWGMAIDLSACVGCAGCVIACQAENNIPTVGPERVDEGREMHWIRIDRYYEGDEENPDMVFQPMLCQHCDHAPCENVCPVAATTHNEEGLNQMTYNRCVGTRYCANNCPYKVRRFNYFSYTGELAAVLQLAANPEVSVRPRGVMEKCTFCVQRINEAKNQAKAEARPLVDGEIKPACAVACAAGAITFGDLNADSEVARLSQADRRYKVLEELGVRPAVTYLAELRNPLAAGGAHES